MSGWIVPVGDGGAYYLLKNNTFYITTESVTGGSDVVVFSLHIDRALITNIEWRFKDWGYIIRYCTPGSYSLKFPVTPPTGVNKTWEVIFTPEDIKIKCNTLQVLHFILNSKYSSQCTTSVKGKKATRIMFWSTATKMFKLQVGK